MRISTIPSVLFSTAALVVAVTTLNFCAVDALQTLSSPPSGSGAINSKSSYTPPVPPAVSPATNLPNRIYDWKEGQQIRYQESGPDNGDPVLLVHGLFVNSDHWRKTIKGLSEEGYKVYAIDLWGYGYSSKPPVDSAEAQAVNGEQRFESTPTDAVIRDIALGTPNGKGTRIRDIDLKHPVQSPYNFYTWSDLLRDFSRDIISSKNNAFPWFGAKSSKPITLVSNSIGTISALQAVLDEPDLYTGVCIVTPNFRELHSAEIPLAQLTMPVVRKVQETLREKGQGLFDVLANKKTVAQILEEPYKVRSAIDDTLVDVLLDPLLLDGASKVVFDTLSYSAGPLPEQQLDAVQKPVWITYGRADPWTPGARVDALESKACVEKVVPLDGIGHCPHDEAPELVNPFLLEFLERVNQNN